VLIAQPLMHGRKKYTMSRRIIYFINPVAGTRKKDLLVKLIEEKTNQQRIPFEIMATNAEGDYTFLKEKIEQEGITDIVVCGGDGTINQVAKTLLEEAVNIGIIPMGSGNGLAFAAGIPKQPAKALDVIFTGKACYIDAFYINDIFSCMLCGLGFDAQVAHDFARQGKRGLATYIQQTIRNFFNARPYSFDLVVKGKSFNTPAYFISIANSNQFGNQFTIAPKASLSDGMLDVVVVKKMNKLRMLLAVMQQIKTGDIAELNDNTFKRKHVLYFQVPRLIINNLQMAPLHIDGDPAATAKRFSVEIIPQAFKLLQPK
jgi:diacylglycerol kinase (ATP)